MNEAAHDRIRPVTIVLIVAAVLTAMLGIAVVVAFLSRPDPITLTITAPAGEVVLCDLLIDGRPETRRDTAPVTYEFQARQVEFAVIPESVAVGDVKIEISAGGGKGSSGGAGARGTASVGAVGGGVSIGNMSPQHVGNMRTSRVEAADGSEAIQDEDAVPEEEPAASSGSL
jgi:hypothetical protein